MAFPWCRRTVAIKTGQPYLVIPIFFENTHTPSSSSSCCEETQLLFIIIFFFGALLASSIFALQGTRASVSNKMIGRSIPCFFCVWKIWKKYKLRSKFPCVKEVEAYHVERSRGVQAKYLRSKLSFIATCKYFELYSSASGVIDQEASAGWFWIRSGNTWEQ